MSFRRLGCATVAVLRGEFLVLEVSEPKATTAPEPAKPDKAE